MFKKPKKKLGVGINYRSEIAHDIISNLSRFDFLEINTERFFHDKNNTFLESILKNLPVVLHGLSLSIGTANQKIESAYLSNLASALAKANCVWFSEHIAMTHVQGLEVRALMPVEFNQDNVNNIVKNVKLIQTITQIPFLLENITYYFTLPNSHFTEWDFICEIINRADCGLLLDINNLYVNSVNHQYDPYVFIDHIPLERVVEVHLAGCNYIHDMLIDTHASRINSEVIALFEYVCQRANINGVVIERDAKLNNFSELLNEVFFVRNIYDKYNPPSVKENLLKENLLTQNKDQ